MSETVSTIPQEQWVRVRAHAPRGFRRAGRYFTREPQELLVADLEEGELEALAAEPNLVVETFERAPVAGLDCTGGDGAGNEPPGDGQETEVPTDPEARAHAILEAIGQIDPEDAEAWTGSGRPKTEALEAVLGWKPTGAERDSVFKTWKEMQEGGTE